MTKRLFLIALFFLSLSMAYSLEPLDWALVFSLSEFDLEEYSGGAGFKVISGPYALRTGVSLTMNDTDDSSDEIAGNWGVNCVFEWHLNENRLSPYLGFEAGWANETLRDEIDDDNWTEDVTNELTLGPVFGGEFHFMENLSFFAEYHIGWTHQWYKVRSSVDGDVDESDSEYDWLVDIGLGNEAMLGFCLYF
ncbi:MAG: hypothetical protein PQJ59_02335 [Spirochaetales bacterium]|nr:hypothetical protein [Spirochaetales bacterium]